MNAIPEFIRHTASTIDEWRQELELYFDLLPCSQEQKHTMRKAMIIKAARLRVVARDLERSKQSEAA